MAKEEDRIAERRKDKIKSGDEIASDKKVCYKKVVIYKNGVFINEKFFANETKKCERIKEMLKKNEIDSEFFDNSGEYIDVELIEKDEDYINNDSNSNYKTVNKNFIRVSLPKEINVDEDGEVFKILACGQITKVRMRGDRSLKELKEILRNITGKNTSMLAGKKELFSNETIDSVKCSLITVNFN